MIFQTQFYPLDSKTGSFYPFPCSACVTRMERVQRHAQRRPDCRHHARNRRLDVAIFIDHSRYNSPTQDYRLEYINKFPPHARFVWVLLCLLAFHDLYLARPIFSME